jgi:outer membrane protein assembly factor BamB
VDLARRLVAIDGRIYVTLGYGKPVSVLDADTGRTLMEYDRTEGTHEIIVDGDVVYVSIIKESDDYLKLEAEALRARLYGRTSEQARAAAARLGSKESRRGARSSGPEKSVMAIHAQTGKVLWYRKEATENLHLNTLTAGNGLVFYQNAGIMFCIDGKSGNVNWRIDRGEALSYSGFQSPTVVLHKDVLLWAAKDPTLNPKTTKAEAGKPRITGRLIAYSTKDGRELWSCPTAETFHAPFEVFVMEDIVWTGGVSKPDEPGLTEGRDYRTGKVIITRPPSPELYQIVGHASCYRNKATERFLLMNRAGIDYIDVKQGRAYSNHFLRGACQYGILPANGYIYAPPHACNCYIYAKLSGYVAMAGKRYSIPAIPDNILEEGPAYRNLPTLNAHILPSDWPTYRYDSRRSSAIKSLLPNTVKKAWELKLEGDLTAPVAAKGLLYVANKATHTLHAIDMDSWSYIAGGQIDSPPTIYNGLTLFGCSDGWVYCLDAGTGELAWRFRAAPNNHQIVSYGKLKSLWPVPGNVLVQDGSAYFVAGRTSYLDGGMFLYKLGVRTGRRLAVRRLYDRDPKTDLEYSEVEDIRQLEGALPDILSSDGESIFLRHRRFNLDLTEQSQDVPHLFSSVGFLDGDWWHRSFWQFGTTVFSGFGGWGKTGNSTISGQLLSFDNTNVYGYGHRLYGNKIYYGLPNKFGHYRLFSMPKSNIDISRIKMATDIPTDKRKQYISVRKQPFEFDWQQRIKVLTRAMVLAGDKLVISGPPDVISEEPLEPQQYDLKRILNKFEEQNDVFAGRHHGILAIVSAKDGKILSEQKLQSPPVFNGMIIANGKVFIADMKGCIVCYR